MFVVVVDPVEDRHRVICLDLSIYLFWAPSLGSCIKNLKGIILGVYDRYVDSKIKCQKQAHSVGVDNVRP